MLSMLSVGRWQAETRERFPVFGTSVGQGGGRVFRQAETEIEGCRCRADVSSQSAWRDGMHRSCMSSTPAEHGGGWKLEMPSQISEGAPQCAIVGKRDTNCECEFWPNLPDPRGRVRVKVVW